VARIGVSSGRSTEFTWRLLWRTAAHACARARRKGGSFIVNSRRLGIPCASRPLGQGMGGGTAKYGEVWAAACDGLRANGGEAVRRPAVERGTRGAGLLP
jgi:hypothetical protein